MTSSWREVIRRLLVLLPLWFLPSCVFTSGASSPAFGGADSNWIPVLVENHGFYDAKIYAEFRGVRFKLGTVPGCSTGRLRMAPETFGSAGPYHLVADLIGSTVRIKTRPIQVVPGGTTVWSLEQSHWLSTVVIR